MVLKSYDKEIHVVGGVRYDGGNHIYSNASQICIEFNRQHGLTFDLQGADDVAELAQQIVDELPALCYPSLLRQAGWNVPDDCIKLEDKLENKF